METIAFYSYKGGVGRSLLVANTARFLGMMGKRVVVMDLDLEAPGLHYKLGSSAKSTGQTGGAVPYLLATSRSAKSPPSLDDHLIDIALPSGSGGSLRLIPAGPAPRREYWTALKQLRERLRFDDPSGKGLAALLDLHARIQDELKPDYLLIDSRTGVTELGGLATTALADAVVCLLVPNQESVDGTLAIVEALKASPRASAQHPIRIVPVVTRVMGENAGSGETAEAIKRLNRLAAADSADVKKEPPAFFLPHDSDHGAADRVVGGDQKASAFSPLHKAYLQLFQHLFPQARAQAEEVLRRLEAVSEFKRRLTEPSRRHYQHNSSFAPWEASAIEEGVVIKSERDSKVTRYADIVCRGGGGKPLIIAEYVPEPEGYEASRFWSEHSKAQCVILLVRQKSGWTETAIYCRAAGYNENLEKADRYEPPAPLEFEIHANPGKQDIAEIIEALHRGNEELVTGVIAEWRECAHFGEREMKRRHGHWRPVEARRILDGLAATEKVEVAARILRHAGRGASGPSEYDDFEWRHFGGEMTVLTQEALFAPLYWRLPVEATFRYLSNGDYPGWTPCLTGYRLLATEIMGLRYDPMHSALKSLERDLARESADNEHGEELEERMLHRMHRRMYREGNAKVSEQPPVLLLWDQQLREERWWSGAPEEVSDKAHERTAKLLGSTSQLRTWLRGRISADGLVTSGLLGWYAPATGRIELCVPLLEALAPILGLQPRYLKSVVFIQLSVIAIAHQAIDCDGQPGYGFAGASPSGVFQQECPAHVILMQYFAFRLIERLGDMNLMGALEKLSEKQPEPYRRWKTMRCVPIERMRAALLRARLGEASIGLPE